MRFNPEGEPLPETARSWAGLVVWPLFVLLMSIGGLAMIREWNTVTSVRASPPATTSATTSMADLSTIAASLATMAAPSPSPTPFPTPTPTPQPELKPTRESSLCGMTARYGEVCEWPMPTPLPPTVIPSCATPIPTESCVWKGA